MIPAANVVNVNGGTGIIVSANGDGSNNMVINVKNDGFAWSELNGDFVATLPQQGFFCNDPAIIPVPVTDPAYTLTLPPTSALATGSIIIVIVDTLYSIQIQANTGQKIQIGSDISAVGGTAISAYGVLGSVVEFVYKDSDSTWHGISSVGTFIVT